MIIVKDCITYDNNKVNNRNIFYNATTATKIAAAKGFKS